MDTCFSETRCAKGPLFYLYPGDLTASCSESRHHKHHLPAQCMLQTIVQEFPTTNNPDDACFFIPGFDTGCTRHSCIDLSGDMKAHQVSIEAKLQALPHWNNDVTKLGGAHFLLLDYNFDKEWPGYDAGAAMVLRSSWEQQTYRHVFDVQLPPLQAGNIHTHTAAATNSLVFKGGRTDDAAMTAVGQSAFLRPLLLFFSGIVFPLPYAWTFGRNFVVSELMSRNRADVVVEAKCAFKWNRGDDQLQRFPHCYGCYWGTREMADGSKEECGDGVTTEMNYTLGLLSSRFILSPRGMGALSYSLIEAIGADSVPVVTGDSTVLPFDGEGKIGELWERCIVLVPESEARAIPEILAAIGPLEYGQRLTACRSLLVEHRTDTLEGIHKQGLCTIIARVALQLLKSVEVEASARGDRAELLGMVKSSLGAAWVEAWDACLPMVL
ncbi:MAG: hypothetical protein WDW36_000146 [Sanguina aurantia]